MVKEKTLSTVQYSSLFTKLLEKRGLTDPASVRAFLFPEIATLLDPLSMRGMPEAVARIRQAVINREKILIHGDYDVDGITGTAVVALTLEKLGADFETFLPERERDGYGVSARAISEAAERGIKILITVDCGVAASEQIKLARKLGLDVIVIDHHRIPASGLPNANIILNPLQEKCPYVFKELSAAGLAFKLSQALLGDSALEYLDLAALSTISDVAPLYSENRVIVKKGLETIAAQKKAGIAALINVSKVQSKKITTTHVGFQLAPRINAAGRMGSPDAALRLLMTGSLKEAASLAQILDGENQARKEVEKRCTKEALQTIERTVNFNRDKVIVVASDEWHVGVIGIVAARLVDKYHRPAIVIGIQNGVGKGSGRSIAGFHLFHAMQHAKDHLLEFGGHAQAAGLSIEPSKVDAFRAAMNQYAAEHLDSAALQPSIEFDLELSLNQIDEVFLSELNLLEPHGAGNPPPRFLTRELKIVSNPRKTPIGVYEAVLSDGSETRMAQIKDEDYLKLVGLPKSDIFTAIYEIRTKSWNGLDSVLLAVKSITL